MRTKQENFLTMAHAVNEIMKKYADKWQNFKRFAKAAQELNELVELTSQTNAKADSTNTGATKDKHGAGFEVIEEGVKLAKRGSIYALDKKNLDLHDRLRFSRSSMLNIHDTEALAKLKEVYELLNPIIAELEDYAILPADMANYKTLLEQYDGLLTKPRELIAARKTLNATVLPEYVNKIRAVLYNTDSLINAYDNTHFYTDYFNARKVVELGTRGEDPTKKPEDPKKPDAPDGETPPDAPKV